MNKWKTVNKNGSCQLIFIGQKGQQLGEREIYAISNGNVRGLLPLNIVPSGSTFKIEYDAAGLISLREFMQKPFNKQIFGNILTNSLSVLKSLRDAYFNPQCVMLDSDKVFVNPTNGHFFFIYVPVQDFNNEKNLKNFFLELSQAEFSSTEDNSFVGEYIRILTSGANFSAFELEEFIAKTFGSAAPVKPNTVSCPRCNKKVPAQAKFCPVCGAAITKAPAPVAEKKDERIYQPIPECEQTAVLKPAVVAKPKPFIVRKKTGEKIPVSNASFKVGKDPAKSDYAVPNNGAVSRHHISIVLHDGYYYVIDKNSTNHTYINGVQIAPEQPVEIVSGSELLLGNEAFTFILE